MRQLAGWGRSIPLAGTSGCEALVPSAVRAQTLRRLRNRYDGIESEASKEPKDVPHPVSETSSSWSARGLPEGDASERCGRSVADPPDDPVVVEAAGDVAEWRVEFLDGAESAQPEQLRLQGPDESLGTAIALGRPHG